jgi:hypothetical protein
LGGERVLAVANFSIGYQIASGPRKKDRFGATPTPARETRALPAPTRIRHSGFVIPLSFVIRASSLLGRREHEHE